MCFPKKIYTQKKDWNEGCFICCCDMVNSYVWDSGWTLLFEVGWVEADQGLKNGRLETVFH